MQDTVDQAHGAMPRALADSIQDASRAGSGWPWPRSPALAGAAPSVQRQHIEHRNRPA